jgi:hypothetical protein
MTLDRRSGLSLKQPRSSLQTGAGKPAVVAEVPKAWPTWAIHSANTIGPRFRAFWALFDPLRGPFHHRLETPNDPNRRGAM